MMPAVFLDRDGVLVEDLGPLCSMASVRVIEGVPRALRSLAQAGYRLIVVTNQTVVARGLLSEAEMALLEAEIEALIERAGAPQFDGFYYCPHHPEATVSRYRMNCSCRKPRAGLLLRAGQDRQIDLGSSFVVGDRMSDVAAGLRAGCRTVLVRSGRHGDPPIVSPEPLDDEVQPHHICADLSAAADWILEGRSA